MQALRKTLLLIIITMSLFLTSGTGLAFPAQLRLDQTLTALDGKNLQAEITYWVPVEDKNSDSLSASTSVIQPPKGWERTVRRVSEQVGGQLASFDITTLKTNQGSSLVRIYNTIRTRAMNKGSIGQRGGAYLILSVDLPNHNNLKELGQRAMSLLGSQSYKQEVSNVNLYSVAGNIPGWGETVLAGSDEINLQIIVRPGSETNVTHLYLLAPDLRGDL